MKLILFSCTLCLIIPACNDRKDFSASGKVTHITGKGPTFALDTSNDQMPDLLLEVRQKQAGHDSLPAGVGDSLTITEIDGVLSSPTRFPGYNLEEVYFVKHVYKGKISAFTNCGFYIFDQDNRRREYQGTLYIPIELGDTVLLVKYDGGLVRYFK